MPHAPSSALPDIAAHEAWFAAYAAGYCAAAAARDDAGPLLLKREHTARVLAHTRTIVTEEGFAPPVARACVLAALYHDVARFEQYARWHTFKDNLSANHGLLGVNILKQEARLKDEAPAVRAWVLAAVGMHNRFALPAAQAEARLVTTVVRDADKLDIFRIMAGHLCADAPYDGTVLLHVANDDSLWTPCVVDACLAGRVASYADLRSVNDFRLLLGTWVDDVRFAATKRALYQSGIVPRLLAPLPDIPEVQAAKAALLRRLQALSAF